jgi:hypothetical protein
MADKIQEVVNLTGSPGLYASRLQILALKDGDDIIAGRTH